MEVLTRRRPGQLAGGLRPDTSNCSDTTLHGFSACYNPVSCHPASLRGAG